MSLDVFTLKSRLFLTGKGRRLLASSTHEFRTVAYLNLKKSSPVLNRKMREWNEQFANCFIALQSRKNEEELSNYSITHMKPLIIHFNFNAVVNWMKNWKIETNEWTWREGTARFYQKFSSLIFWFYMLKRKPAWQAIIEWDKNASL